MNHATHFPETGLPYCTICRQLLPREPCHVAGILIDGRMCWATSCQHFPVHGAQIRLGSPHCAMAWAEQHPEWRLALIKIIRDGENI